MASRIQPSSGNVFTDLGFGAEEAQNLKARSDLMFELARLIEARGLTQAAAAKLLGGDPAEGQ
jgi:predicted XRE-type DNA-binding protein